MLDFIIAELDGTATAERWVTQFQPGQTTLGTLVRSAARVDFALFVFGPDDQTTSRNQTLPSARDNVVFEAGLFAGTIGVERTFMLHATDTKLPSDLLGLTLFKYKPNDSIKEQMGIVGAVLRPLIEDLGSHVHNAATTSADESKRDDKLLGHWWQFTLSDVDPERSTVSLMEILRFDEGSVGLSGRSWSPDGKFLARYDSLSATLNHNRVFYYWEGVWPTQEGLPTFSGKGEIQLRSANRASGYFTSRCDTKPDISVRVEAEYLRAQAEDLEILEGTDTNKRASLIHERLQQRGQLVLS